MLSGARIKLFDPVHPYISRYVEEYAAIPLLKQIFDQGKLVYELPDLHVIRSFHKEQLGLFRPELLRKLNPELYAIHLSEKCWQLKMDLIQAYSKQ